MQQILLFISGLSGSLAVALGALGAHFLKDKITTYQLETFEKAVLYHFLHSLALLGLIAVMNRVKTRALIVSAACFIAGILFFSGSLYLLATRDFLLLTDWTFLGPLTPVGGFFFILGWIMIAFSAFRT